MGFWVVRFPAIVVIGLWFILQLVSSYNAFEGSLDGGGVAYFAHVGGFIAGFILSFIFR